MLYEDDEEGTKFRNLKSRLRTILLNSILLEKRTSRDEQYDARNECYSNLFIIKVLKRNNAHKSVKDFAKKTLCTAENYEITEIALSASKILKEEANLSNNIKDFEFFHQKLESLRLTYNAELTSGNYLENIVLKLKNSALPPHSLIINYVETVIQELDTYYPNVNSATYILNYLSLKIYLQRAHSNFNKMVSNANKGLKIIKQNPHLNFQNLYGHFLNEKLKASYGKNNLSIVNQTIREGNENLPPFTEHWFAFKELQLVANFQNEEFQNAERIFEEVYFNEHFNNVNQLRFEKWRIFQACFWVLKEINWYVPENLNVNPNFRLYKFQNETPVSFKDKKGYNITLLILEYLIFLAKENFKEISERSESLQLYVKRYLSDSQTIRSKIFMKMLITLEKQDFDYQNTFNKTYSLFKELRANSFEIIDIDRLGPEIINFERLWVKCLKFLKSKSTC